MDHTTPPGEARVSRVEQSKGKDDFDERKSGALKKKLNLPPREPSLRIAKKQKKEVNKTEVGKGMAGVRTTLPGLYADTGYLDTTRCIVGAIDSTRLNDGILERGSENGKFSWSRLGFAVGTIIKTTPPANTMLGQVEAETFRARD